MSGAQLRRAGAVPFNVETFEAFRLRENGEALPLDTYPTFEDALQMASASSVHKAKFAIQRTNTLTGEIVLHVYAIKQKSKPTYVHREHQTVRIHQHYAEHLLDMRLPAPLTGASA